MVLQSKIVYPARGVWFRMDSVEKYTFLAFLQKNNFKKAKSVWRCFLGPLDDFEFIWFPL